MRKKPKPKKPKRPIKKPIKGQAQTKGIFFANCNPSDPQPHEKHGDKMIFGTNETGVTYTVTWPIGSPFTGFLNPGDQFDVSGGSPVTQKVDKTARNNGFAYPYTLAKNGVACNLGGGGPGGGGGDVIIDP